MPPLSIAPGGVKPFLKWAGGKAGLADAYRRFFPLEEIREGGGTWHEPFVGGGALFFLWQPPRARLSDANPLLIDTWLAVRDEVRPLVQRLRELQASHGAEQYYRLRDHFNAEKDTLPALEKAALLLYFNRTGFNGLWRMNRRGEFNVPFGRYANPDVVRQDRLAECSRILRREGVKVEVRPFERVLERARPGDIVYLDPPYAPLSTSSKFVDYASEGFDEDDQRRLRDVARELHRRGARVRVSNSSAPLVRGLYGEAPFRIHEILARRSVNRDTASRGPITELLIVADPAPRPPRAEATVSPTGR